jgi:hypothetical protein
MKYLTKAFKNYTQDPEEKEVYTFEHSVLMPNFIDYVKKYKDKDLKLEQIEYKFNIRYVLIGAFIFFLIAYLIYVFTKLSSLNI